MEAESIMRAGIHLASHSASSSTRESSVALSLGPFGATLRPGQEYAGLYPPPYGPPPPAVPFISASAGPTNAFPDTEEGKQEQRVAAEKLAEFHLDRLRVFAADRETWEMVRWLAFETVPVLHEVLGIRLAMKRLRLELQELYGTEGGADGKGPEGGEGGRMWWDKPFWITSPFPEGVHPQLLPSGEHASVDDFLCFSLLPELDMSLPDGVGINCTHPRYLSTLPTAFNRALGFLLESNAIPPADKPMFVLYPDGGATYDVVSRTWTDRNLDADGWAREVGSCAREMEGEMWLGEKLWKGVIVGGCCKAGFDEIGALRKELDARDA
jgi:homocysteine S-methyltransferase